MFHVSVGRPGGQTLPWADAFGARTPEGRPLEHGADGRPYLPACLPHNESSQKKSAALLLEEKRAATPRV